MQVNKEPTNKHITVETVRQVGYIPEPSGEFHFDWSVRYTDLKFNFQQCCKGKFRVQK